jgi:hypothetical protein
LRFNKYCERLQSLLNETFNLEFKAYLSKKGINIDPNIFDLKFNPPQNFAAYRQAEMDGVRMSAFTSIVSIPFMSKRFALKRFLGLTTEEIAENERQWREENVDKGTNLSAQAELRSAGITAGGITSDLDTLSASGTAPEGMEDMTGDAGGGEMPAGGASPSPAV